MPVSPPRLFLLALLTSPLLACAAGADASGGAMAQATRAQPSQAQTAPAPPGATPATQDMHQLMHDYLEREVRRQGLQGEAHIQIDGDSLARQAPCAQTEVFLAGQGTLRSRFSLGLRCLAPTHWVAYVPVQLRVMGVYPVAARPLQPHTVLGENDLTLREGDLMRLPADAAMAPEDVLGHTTIQRIAANQVFKHNTLQAPQSILRGQAVTLEVRGSGFTVSGEGMAMQSGEPGALIQVRMPSGQIIHGRVLNAQTVLLTM